MLLARSAVTLRPRAGALRATMTLDAARIAELGAGITGPAKALRAWYVDNIFVTIRTMQYRITYYSETVEAGFLALPEIGNDPAARAADR